MKKKTFDGRLPVVRNPNRPKPGSEFEGPLKPGRIRVPRSPITNPRDLLPPSHNPKDIEKKIERIRKKAYREGYLAGHGVGYALGVEDERKNSSLRDSMRSEYW